MCGGLPRPLLRALSLALVGAALIGACAPATLLPSASTSPVVQEIPSQPPGEPVDATTSTACATRVFEALFTAINASDAAALEHLIGPGRGDLQKFRWFSLTEGTTKHVVDYDADAARRTLLARTAAGERWTLISVRSLGGTQWDGGVHAEVFLDRTLADGSVITTHGKTVLSCIKSAIYVLSLGNP